MASTSFSKLKIEGGEKRKKGGHRREDERVALPNKRIIQRSSSWC